MSTALTIAGLVLGLIGCVMLLTAAFRTSVGWGLSALFIPGAILFFVVRNWQEARRGFFTLLIAVGLICGAGLAKGIQEEPSTASGQRTEPADRARSGAARSEPAAPPVSAEPGPQPGPTQHWMGQAREAGDTQRQSTGALETGAAGTEQP